MILEFIIIFIINRNLNDIHVYCIANTIKYKHTLCITVEQVKFANNKFVLIPVIQIVLIVNYLIILKMANKFLYSYIALLFTCMLSHGVSPIAFCLSVIVPIPKNKSSNKCGSRVIAISTLFGFFWTILSLKVNTLIYLQTYSIDIKLCTCMSTRIF